MKVESDVFMLSKSIRLKILKIAIGGCLAFIFADLLKLEYAISASIITLLTIQETKKETLLVAVRRFGSFLVAMILAAFIFSVFGYNPIVYGVFIFFFCYLCYQFNFQDGIASSAVLTTHVYLLNQISIPILWNETLLMIVGVGIGVLLNMIMPNNVEKIKENQKRIEDIIKQIIDQLSELIIDPTLTLNIDKLLQNLDIILDKTMKQSIDNSNNTLLVDTTYYLSYVQMRKNQALQLRHMSTQMSSLEVNMTQAHKISLFMKEISSSLHEYNNAVELLNSLHSLTSTFEEDDLPTSRIEFEHRALLFSLLHDLDTFLEIKKDFIDQLTEEQIRRYQMDDK